MTVALSRARKRRSLVRLLVVEDGERMVTLLKRALEEDGYAVDVARKGADALWLGQGTTTTRSYWTGCWPGWTVSTWCAGGGPASGGRAC
jgi:hypothetical protein